MRRINFCFLSLFSSPRWKIALFITTGGLFAFLFWTLPNWGEFWNNAPQFSGLWQISSSRMIIISLAIKITSPLLIMSLMGATVWIYYLMKPLWLDEEASISSSEQERHEEVAEKAYHAAAISSPEGKPAVQVLSFSPQSLTQFPSLPEHFDPEIPRSSALSLPVVSMRQEEAARSPTYLAEEQSITPGHQRIDTSIESTTLSTIPPLVPIPGISQLGVSTTEHDPFSGPCISIHLLKEVSLVIHVPGGSPVVVPLSMNAKRVQLLAYIAWRRGEAVDRDKMLEQVFGWGLSDEEATEEKLSERFESHKKLLRKAIRTVVIEQINGPAGKMVIDPELDPFVHSSGFWRLSAICRVNDIEAIEASYKIISAARKEGKLVDEIPDYVKEACEHLIADYPGDFLQSLMKKYPGEFRLWEGRSSWARKPFTLYRDYYLDALWYSAEYEWRQGQRYSEASVSEANQKKLQEHYSKAADLYQTYAMYACNTRFDMKATLNTRGDYGERIGMSERALRRCVVLLGAIGKTDMIEQVWSAYCKQMQSIYEKRWQPGKETEADVQAARAQTNAYRFAAQIAQVETGD